MRQPEKRFVLSDNHWRLELYRERVRRKEAQQALIDHPTIIFHGYMYWLKAKHIGAGVYELYKEKMQ